MDIWAGSERLPMPLKIPIAVSLHYSIACFTAESKRSIVLRWAVLLPVLFLPGGEGAAFLEDADIPCFPYGLGMLSATSMKIMGWLEV